MDTNMSLLKLSELLDSIFLLNMSRRLPRVAMCAGGQVRRFQTRFILLPAFSKNSRQYQCARADDGFSTPTAVQVGFVQWYQSVV